MTPAQVAHIMALVDNLGAARFQRRNTSDIAKLRAAVEAALRDAPQQAEPLTDEQIWASDEIMGANGTVTQLPMDELRAVVRAVEFAHGITASASKGTK